jgi:4,4'-diaponeurosporenoate glycosyltransferase
MASGAGRDRTGAAFGPVVVCWAADYQWAGGHEPAGVLDDVALARAFRAEGLPVTVRAGRGTAWFRMYPLGLGQLVEGWSKNMAQGARSATRPVVLVLTVLWIVAMATAAVPHGWLASGGAYAAVAAQLAVLERRVGRFSAWVWVLWPVALAFFVVVFAWSVVLTATGRPVRWRGRRVAAAP